MSAYTILSDFNDNIISCLDSCGRKRLLDSYINLYSTLKENYLIRPNQIALNFADEETCQKHKVTRERLFIKYVEDTAKRLLVKKLMIVIPDKFTVDKKIQSIINALNSLNDCNAVIDCKRLTGNTVVGNTIHWSSNTLRNLYIINLGGQPRLLFYNNSLVLGACVNCKEDITFKFSMGDIIDFLRRC